MCDTVVAVPPATADGAVWFGKNSDREPGEAQVVEHLPAARHPSGAKVRCTYLELPQAEATREVVLSRPFWGFGCEMGANDAGLAIGNEAVWTRLPVARTGLTGMDLQRLALERASSAREALELMTRLLEAHGQGGNHGYRHKSFRYHNAFVLADPHEAWVLETAGPFWAAERVLGVRTISNVLTIGKEMDRVHPGAADFARKKGWLGAGEDFDFARCFGDPWYRVLSGGEIRRACTRSRLSAPGRVTHASVLDALRDHGGRTPEAGLRLEMPCAHASWLPTRHAGQTTGSMVSRLSKDGCRHWLTGTSSPCLSVFKPVVLGQGKVDTGPSPGGGYDPESLFWRHERLHRHVLRDHVGRKNLFDTERDALEARIRDAASPRACAEAWAEHREAVLAWTDRVERAPTGRRMPFFSLYWQRHSRLDRLPLADAPARATGSRGPRA